MKSLFLTLVLILSACTKNPATTVSQKNSPNPYIPAENDFSMELATSTINLEMHKNFYLNLLIVELLCKN